MLKVFHGSDHIIKQPCYLGGKADNDYGNGFYTTEYEERAKSWAALNGNPQKSIVNVYHLDLTGMRILDLNECGVLAWIAEVVANRGTNQEAARYLFKLIGRNCCDAFSAIVNYMKSDYRKCMDMGNPIYLNKTPKQIISGNCREDNAGKFISKILSAA